MRKIILLVVFLIIIFIDCSQEAAVAPEVNVNPSDYGNIDITLNWEEATADVSKISALVVNAANTKSTGFEGAYQTGIKFSFSVLPDDYMVAIKYYNNKEELLAEQYDSASLSKGDSRSLNFILFQSDIKAVPIAPVMKELAEQNEGVGIGWSLDSTIESGFEIARSVDNINFLTIGSTLPANAVSFIDKVIVPGSSYYYKIRSYNKFGYSDWSNVLNIKLSGEGTLGKKITKVVITELDGKSSTLYPLTISHIFREKDVYDALTFSISGQGLPTQTDIKSRYSDGSIKHALLSTILPELKARGEIELGIHIASNANTTDPLGDELLSDMEFDMIFDFDSCGKDVSLKSLLASGLDKKNWLNGSIAREILVTNFSASDVGNPVSVNAAIRYYKDTKAVRVLYSVENCRADVRQICSYSLKIDGVLKPTGGAEFNKTVFGPESVAHNNDARWAKIVWIGESPSNINVVYDKEYLVSTKILPPYDTSINISTAAIDSVYNSYIGSDTGIMGNGVLNKYFPSTGWRMEIGLYPQWSAMYMLSMDRKMFDVTIGTGFLSGSAPIHYRETKDIDYFGRIISVDDRPTIWLGQNDGGQGFTYLYTEESDRMPNKTGDVDTTWSIDRAHQGSFAFIPYIFTGEFFFLEEIYFWAAYDVGCSNPGYRENEKGLIKDQVRGEAWAIRNIADAAFIAPDSDSLMKNYFTEKLNNSLLYWIEKYITNGFHPIGCWDYISNWGCDGGRPQRYFKPNVRYMASPWQEDFILIVMNHLTDLGFSNAVPLKERLAGFLVGRGQLPWQRFNSYQIPVSVTKEGSYDLQDFFSEPISFISNWSEVESYFIYDVSNLPEWYPEFDSIGAPITYVSKTPEEEWSDSWSPAPFDYPTIAMSAAAGAVDYPGAGAVYEALRSKLAGAIADFSSNPTFGFKPRIEE
ncbi:MAG: hypothetical protein KA885_01435 [Spirochaetes bacterium]|nr:hypothetical protein [Spirochaetota bacterium]